MRVIEAVKALLRRPRGRKAAMEEKCLELELRCRELEKRLEDCLRPGERGKLRRMAGMLRLGLKAKRFTPAYASEQLGMKAHMVQDYLAELLEAGLVERIRRGYYRVNPGLEDKDPETEIARALARGRERRKRGDGS